MAIYELTADGLKEMTATTFSRRGIRERTDLQRLLREQIDVIAPGTLVVAEEFGEWEDSRRRIDLLGIDAAANLVVIELKRTEDGGHMELQAVRYAAMVSALTFEKVVDIYGRFLEREGKGVDPRQTILEFLGWDAPDEDAFAQAVRIVLASAEFSRELTTAVMWLNDQGLDIRCVRLRPYEDGDRTLIDVQTVIPLPEAEDYQIRIREKQQRERESRRSGRDYTRFEVAVADRVLSNLPKRWAIYHVVRHLVAQGVSPQDIADTVAWRSGNMFWVVPGRHGPDSFVGAAAEVAHRIGRTFDPRRFFLQDDALIYFGDSTYAFSNQWGERTEEALGLLKRRFPQVPFEFVPQ